MRVFVTGATGFIGEAVVADLLRSGHTVLGLARSEAGAAALVHAGADVHRGELADTDSLIAGARACDGVAHLAFIHDFSNFEASCVADRQAVAAMGGALEGTGKPLVVTSGTALLTPGRIVTEDDAPAETGAAAHRGATDAVVMDVAGRGVRASVLRLPPSVHGAGDRGFVPMLIDLARRTGVAAFVGDGANRWPAVHRLDAARLFRLALEKAEPGARLLGAAEEGIPMRRIAEAIGTALGLPTGGISETEAAAHFTWMARFVAIDNPVSSALTQATMDWHPHGPDLLTDMREGGYFR